MRLFGYNISVNRSDAPTQQRSTSPAAAAWLRGDDIPDYARSNLSNAFEQTTWVYRAATVLAEQIANIPFLFSHGERGREQSITSGPLIDFYNRPHPYINRFQYWELRVLWLLLRGECFRIPIYEDSSSLGTLHPENFMQISKVSRFPIKIREELNRRLEASEKSGTTLKWLNGLPEVQAVLQKEFEGEPMRKQNLYKWKKSKSYEAWQLRQTALRFTEDSLPDDLDPATLDKMSDKLLRTIQLRYAALASDLPPPSNDPEVELRRLGELCNNLVILRRGDLSAGRLAVEQQRLAMEKARADEQKESEFWEWTKRPDIQAKLYPHHDPDQQRRDVDRLVSERLLGIRHSESNHTPHPINGPGPDPEPNHNSAT